ncbi:FtsX-like permease family protein [Mesorhizobium sp. VK25A]|uniref:FtsX-like permease family protein n=1 Tax=Mesorhizobium vachelliae TaxID=3072309 RepID=A0ABU5A6I3_9HYPH|nr:MULTISPECIES: FtsX-like permease family protein [unclassified Mesorhizobium]MDX8533314.1 FtsX-like permease family protein [Mesorhizobium sp. VK25D]MDX8545233.1 FtsX-like permease family protein [Mesorhizobium sp. VK25A]
MRRWLTFAWIAALRFLGEGRMQTGFILVGIAIGVGVIVFMSAMLTSVQTNFTNRVLSSQPHIQLQPPDEVARPLRQRDGIVEAAIVQRPTQRVLALDQWQTIRARMQARPDVVVATPSISGSALAVRGDVSRSIGIVGIEADDYFRIVRLPDYIVAGEPRLESDDILVGLDLANDLGVTVGDKLNVASGNGGNRVLTIRGIFDLGNRGVNERNTYVQLRTAQSLLNLIGGVTDIDMTVTDVYAAESIAQDIGATLPVKAESWIVTNAQFFTALWAQTLSSLLIRSFVGLSVAFGIAAVLVVSVLQRSKDIGILRAMGSSRGKILRVFLIQGGVLGFLGSLLGCLLGGAALFAWYRFARQPNGDELFPLLIEPSLFAFSALLATVTGVLAGMVPAFRAARLDPVEAIRG